MTRGQGLSIARQAGFTIRPYSEFIRLIPTAGACGSVGANDPGGKPGDGTARMVHRRAIERSANFSHAILNGRARWARCAVNSIVTARVARTGMCLSAKGSGRTRSCRLGRQAGKGRGPAQRLIVRGTRNSAWKACRSARNSIAQAFCLTNFETQGKIWVELIDASLKEGSGVRIFQFGFRKHKFFPVQLVPDRRHPGANGEDKVVGRKVGNYRANSAQLCADRP